MPNQSQVKYALWSQFIKNTVIEAGYATASGRANLKGFYDTLSPCLEGSGLSLSYQSFMAYANNKNPNPSGDKVEALAVLLSHARGAAVLVSDLDSLVNREALAKFDEEIALDELPDKSEGDTAIAGHLLNSFCKLPIAARQSVAPGLLNQIAFDIDYAEASRPEQLSILLKREINMRGIGLAAYAKAIGGKVPLENLEAILYRREHPTPLTLDQLIILSQQMRGIDGENLNVDDLCALNPQISRARLARRLAG
jgi:hypothetical protein